VRVFALPGMVMIAWPPALTSGGAPPSKSSAPPAFQIPADQDERGCHVCDSIQRAAADHSQFNGQFARIRGVRRRVYRAARVI
jgi:hypothetical protein